MAKKLVRRARVRGYRPTRSQLEQLLELAQRGIDSDSTAQLTYSQGDVEIYPHGDLKKVVPADLQEIITDAGDPEGLNNLGFSITQNDPIRIVKIDIGPGQWTIYQVESEDQTWAYGRYHELTDEILNDRTVYAKFRSSRPQVLREGTDDKWRPSAWEPKKDWRVLFMGVLAVASFIVLFLAAAYAAGVAAVAYTKTTGSGLSKQEIQQNIQTQKDALAQIHWMGAHLVCY